MLKGLLFIPILTKSIGTFGYGIYSEILITITILSPLAMLQLEYAMIRFLGDESNQIIDKGISAIISIILFSSVCTSLLFFIFSDNIAVVFGGPIAIPFVKLTSLLIFLNTIDLFVQQYFIAFRKNKSFSFIRIFEEVGSIILIVILIMQGYGLWGVIYSLIIIKIIVVIIGLIFVKINVNFEYPSISLAKNYLIFSLPLIPFSFAYMFVNTGDRYVIGYFIGSSAVGIYSAAYSLAMLVGFLFTPVSQILLPYMTHIYEKEGVDKLKNFLKYSFKMLISITIISFFGIVILSKSLLILLTTPDFVNGYILIPFIGLGVILYNFSNYLSNILILFKKNKILSKVYMFGMLLNVILNICLVPIIGILGAAIVTLITFLVMFLLIFRQTVKLINFDLSKIFIIKCIISAIIMDIVIWKLNPLTIYDVILSILIGTLVFFGLLIILKGFTKEEYDFIKTILLKRNKD